MSFDLSSLAQTPGVRAVAVFDAQGECLAHQVPVPYEPILLWDAAGKLADAFDCFSGMGQVVAVNSFCVHCDDGCLVLRKIDDLMTVVLAAPTVNTAMLNVALNVLALNLARAMKANMTPVEWLGARMLTPPPGSVATGHGLGAGYEPGRSAPPPPVQTVSLVSEPPPADAVDAEAVRELLHLLQRVAGPAAKLLLKQELGRLGVSVRTMRRGQWNDFVDAVSRRIADTDKRSSFAAAAKPLVC